MGSCKKTFILILLMFLYGFLAAQQEIASITQNVGYRVPFHLAGGKLYDPGNAILREMAKEVLREPWLVNVNISCHLEFTIIKEKDRSRLFIRKKSVAIHGDTVFRHFPVADVLLPSSISMNLRWANRADTSGYTEQAIEGKSFSGPDSLICILPAGSYDPEVDTLLVRQVELFYDSLALRRFVTRIDLIHDYYASVSLLDSLQRLSDAMNLADASLLPLNYLKVVEFCNVLARIDTLDFRGNLLWNGYDPLELMRKYRQGFKQSRSHVFNYIDEMHRAGAIPWDGDVDRLAGYFTARVFSYIRNSYLMDQQQSHIYGDCLNHFYDHSPFPAGEEVEAKMMVKMFPAARPDTLALYITSRIYASFRNRAQQLMDQNQFAEAFSMMENGLRFIDGNLSPQVIAADELLQSQAAGGIFNSFVGIASRCISGHNLNMAAIYLSKAEQYADSHRKYIRSDSSYRRLFSELFFLRNSDCDQLLDQKRYDEALDCYQQFEKSYPTHDLALVSTQLEEKKSMARLGLSKLSVALTADALKSKSADTALFYYEQAKTFRHESKIHRLPVNGFDSLAPVMVRIKYKQLVREGTEALEKRQFTLSVKRLNKARVLADSNRIDRSREFDSVYRQAMKHLLIVQLSVSQKKIWANQFDSARLAIERTRASASDFGLLNDPELDKAMENFRIKIREQQCRNIKDSVDLRMIRADRSIALRNYMNAVDYLRQALDFSHLMPECGIDEKQILDSVAKYSMAAGYQQRQADARSLVVVGNYEDAMHVLDSNQRVFLENQLGRFGLQMDSVVNFIRERDNPYLSEKAISYYTGKENYPEALTCLKLAHDQGSGERSLANLQNQLGWKLAQDDYRKNPYDDSMKNAAKYVPSDGWFEAFRSSYTDEWYRLGKSAAQGTK